MSDFEANTEYEVPSSEEGAVEEELPELSDYGRRFVENAPEEEKHYADKYVRMWDDGHKKQVGKYEEELGRYRQLGSYEDVQTGVRLFSVLRNEPQRLLEYLVNDPEGPQLTVAQAKAAMEDAAENTERDPNAEKYAKLEKAVLALAQEREAEKARTAQERAQAEFMASMTAAAKKYGEFDQKIVAGMIAAGHAQTIDEAVQHYHKIVGKPQRKAIPSLLGASSAAPSGAKKLDMANATSKERENYISHLLMQE